MIAQATRTKLLQVFPQKGIPLKRKQLPVKMSYQTKKTQSRKLSSLKNKNECYTTQITSESSKPEKLSAMGSLRYSKTFALTLGSNAITSMDS
jgi:hypothetical protein